jgi:PAS domain S-box-containing protein
MAEGLVKSMELDFLEVYSAGIRADGVHPKSIEVMKEIGIDISGQTSKEVSSLGINSFDLIITLCDPAKDYCLDPNLMQSDQGNPIFVGVPVHVHWSIPDPAAIEGSEQEILEGFRYARDELKDKITTMVDLGYLSSLDIQRKHTELYLDAIEDGIILHDQNRNIFLFNQAAENITGYKREEVQGANCHTIFAPDGLCGSQCPLTSGDIDSYSGCNYEVSFRTKDGEDRRLKIRSAPVTLLPSNSKGVVATIRDITEVSELRWTVKKMHSFHGMVGLSKPMQDIFQTIRSLATSDYPVMITGDSGTGKELVARAVHNEGRRGSGPFVPINCGALPEHILESELFGHVRGAFTGAIRDKKGRFELADQGTIFLDELGELSPTFQVKLLRVLEEKRFEPVGGEKSISVDVRVISATNRDLKELIEQGKFREDLYYRLCVVPIHLPPLTKRREDIPMLVEHILKSIKEESGKEIESISSEAMNLLYEYHWPGNIRQLINILQFASVRSNSTEILPSHLPPEISKLIPITATAGQPAFSLGGQIKKQGKLNKEAVEQALNEAGGNKVKAAKLLGVGRATLYRYLTKHSVS